MNLSIKLFLIALSTIMIIIFSIIWLSYSVVLADYEAMETKDIQQEILRTNEALNRIKDSLALIAVDWAHWDDSYKFLAGKDTSFIKINLMNEGSFVDTTSDFILFYDNNGKYFAGNSFDSKHKQFIPVPKNLLDFIYKNKFILKHQDSKDTITGFIIIPEGLLLLSSTAVSNSASSATPNGNVIFAYYFDNKHLNILAKTLQVNLDLYYLHDIADNTELQNIARHLDQSNYYIVPVNDKILYYYSLLSDITNKPIALLRTTFPRTTYQEGLHTIHTYIMLILITGLIILIFAQLLLRFSILNRINSFKNQLNLITFNQDFSKHIEMTGKDEIYDVADNCNKMLDVISSTKDQLNLSIQELTRNYTKIQSTNDELVEREHAMVLINKVNEKLQMCQDITEAYSVISETANELFVSWNGGIAIADPISNELKTVTQWGNQKILKNSFLPSECWAIRSGNIYIVEKYRPKLDCHHFISNEVNKYLCIPLIVSGKIIGILNLSADNDVPITDHYRQQLAITLSEMIALSLTNINLRDSLREQSIHDPLTGLFNRRYLEEQFPIEVQRAIRNKQVLSVGMIDIDFFKKFNDTYGHNAGDEVLKRVGLLLFKNFRYYDLACRFGGEEFLVIMVDSNMTKANERMQAFCDEIKNSPVYFNKMTLPPVTVSIGLAEVPAHGSSLEDVVRKADLALYNAKNNGRNRIEIYSESK